MCPGAPQSAPPPSSSVRASDVPARSAHAHRRFACVGVTHCLHEIDRDALWGDASRRRQMAAVDGVGKMRGVRARTLDHQASTSRFYNSLSIHKSIASS